MDYRKIPAVVPKELKDITCPCIFKHRPIYKTQPDGSLVEMTEEEIVEAKVAYYLLKYPEGV